MKLLFTFAVLGLIVPQPQNVRRETSELDIVQLSFVKKSVEQPTFAPRMVSNRPPLLNPDPNLLQGNRNDPFKDRRQPDVSKIGGLSHEDTPGTRFSARVSVYVFRTQMKNTPR